MGDEVIVCLVPKGLGAVLGRSVYQVNMDLWVNIWKRLGTAALRWFSHYSQGRCKKKNNSSFSVVLRSWKHMEYASIFKNQAFLSIKNQPIWGMIYILQDELNGYALY